MGRKFCVSLNGKSVEFRWRRRFQETGLVLKFLLMKSEVQIHHPSVQKSLNRVTVTRLVRLAIKDRNALFLNHSCVSLASCQGVNS